MKISGKELVHTSSSFACPRYCASCMAPSTTEVTTKKRKSVSGGSETLSMNIPYCNDCAQRARGAQWREWGATGAVAVPIVLLSGLVFLIPGLPLAAVIAIVTVPPLLAAVGVMIALAPKMPPAPATHPGEAVSITSFKLHQKSVLFCSNAQWADQFAQMNPGTATALPKDRNHIFALAALPIALLGAPLAAAGAFFGTHPTVHVDNPSPDTLSIFVDGKYVTDVAAGQNTSFSVAHGKRKMGWAKGGGASAPTSTVDAEVEINDAHLYNPARSGCYWLVANGYGTTSVKGMQQGPQPLQEWYKFDKVDTWFGSNPTSISVGKGQTGGTKVALQRADVCMTYAQKGCSAEAREKLMICEKAAYLGGTEASFAACSKEADAACHSGGGTASAAHPATPAAPPPKPAHK